MTWQFHAAHPFAAHAPTWDALQLATTNTPFLEAHFIEPLLTEFGEGNELLALHQSARGIDAAAILRPRGRGRWETFQPSQLPLGPWLSARDDNLSIRLHSLIRALPGTALGVGLTQIDPRLHARPTTTAAIRTDNYIRTSHVEVTGTFDAYWEQRGKNLRQNMRKQRNKLQADGIATRLDCVTDAAGVPQALVDYGRLETTGWKSDAGTAIHPDNAQGRFYRAVLERFCAAGRGRIYRYWFNDTVVAMDLCIDNGPLVVVLKTAYDEAQRQVSPSVLMRQEQFEAWWAEGRYRRIEFYGKTLEWHTRWTALERELYHVTAYRWGWLQQAAKWLVRRDGAPPAVAPDAQAAKSAA